MFFFGIFSWIFWGWDSVQLCGALRGILVGGTPWISPASFGSSKLMDKAGQWLASTLKTTGSANPGNPWMCSSNFWRKRVGCVPGTVHMSFHIQIMIILRIVSMYVSKWWHPKDVALKRWYCLWFDGIFDGRSPALSRKTRFGWFISMYDYSRTHHFWVASCKLKNGQPQMVRSRKFHAFYLTRRGEAVMMNKSQHCWVVSGTRAMPSLINHCEASSMNRCLPFVGESHYQVNNH